MSHNVSFSIYSVIKARGASAAGTSGSRTPGIRAGATAAAAIVLLGGGLTACGDKGSGARPAGGAGAAVKPGTSGVPTETAAAKTHTADRLQQALLTQETNGAGYKALAAPLSGEYGKLKAVADFKKTQASMKVQPAHCGDTAKGSMSSQAIMGAASAIGTLSKADRVFSETLLAVSPETARVLVGYEVPADCRTYKVRVGTQNTTNRVAVSEAGRLGQGSRTVGVVTKVGSRSTRTWAITVTSRGYVLVITLSGPTTTRAEAEKLARTSHRQAERVLT